MRKINILLRIILAGVIFLLFTAIVQTYILADELHINRAVIGLESSQHIEINNLPISYNSQELGVLQRQIMPIAEKEDTQKTYDCDLTFWSNKDGGYWETPPAGFIKGIRNYDCESQKWLSRIAHYESEYNPEAKNGYFEGLYQIGSGDTRDFCINNGRNASDEDCALYLITWLDTMPLMFESHHLNPNSFSDLSFIF